MQPVGAQSQKKIQTQSSNVSWALCVLSRNFFWISLIIEEISGQLYTCPFPGDLDDWEAFVKYAFIEFHRLNCFLLLPALSELGEYESRYKVYNLSGRKYDYSIFKGIGTCYNLRCHSGSRLNLVVEYEMEIKEAPPLKLLQECVADIVCCIAEDVPGLGFKLMIFKVLWISGDVRNMALIHCAGKATRTTLVVASVLLKLHKFPSADLAIASVSDVTQCVSFSSLCCNTIQYLFSLWSLQVRSVMWIIFIVLSPRNLIRESSIFIKCDLRRFQILSLLVDVVSNNGPWRESY